MTTEQIEYELKAIKQAIRGLAERVVLCADDFPHEGAVWQSGYELGYDIARNELRDELRKELRAELERVVG